MNIVAMLLHYRHRDQPLDTFFRAETHSAMTTVASLFNNSALSTNIATSLFLWYLPEQYENKPLIFVKTSTRGLEKVLFCHWEIQMVL